MAKRIDNKGRIFGKVSVIDLFVVVFALAMVFAFYLRFFRSETTSVRAEDADTFTYTVKIDGVRQWTVDGFHEGEQVWDSDNDTLLGTIKEIEAVPATAEVSLVNGTTVVTEKDNRFDIYLTIEADGLISENGRYFASRTYELGVNTPIYLYTKYCWVSGTVWDLA